MFERSKLVSGSCFIGFMFIPLQTDDLLQFRTKKSAKAYYDAYAHETGFGVRITYQQKYELHMYELQQTYVLVDIWYTYV
ncbi:hypothetical protein LINPERHAP1_LOCUS28853 [Linum perenne]